MWDIVPELECGWYKRSDIRIILRDIYPGIGDVGINLLEAYTKSPDYN